MKLITAEMVSKAMSIPLDTDKPVNAAIADNINAQIHGLF